MHNNETTKLVVSLTIIPRLSVLLLSNIVQKPFEDK